MSRAALLALLAALAALLLWWYGIHERVGEVPRWAVLLVLVGPLLFPAVLLALSRPSGPFWAGFVTLLHFCHGVMEAWTESSQRLPALIEVALVLAIYAILLRDGLRARRLKKALAGAEQQTR